MSFNVDFDAGEIVLEQTLDSFEQAAALVEKIWGAAALLWPEANLAHDAALAEAEKAQQAAKPVAERRRNKDGLTPRRQQVLDLLKEGLSVTDATKRTGVSPSYIYAQRLRFIAEGRLS